MSDATHNKLMKIAEELAAQDCGREGIIALAMMLNFHVEPLFLGDFPPPYKEDAWAAKALTELLATHGVLDPSSAKLSLARHVLKHEAWSQIGSPKRRSTQHQRVWWALLALADDVLVVTHVQTRVSQKLDLAQSNVSSSLKALRLVGLYEALGFSSTQGASVTGILRFP